MAGPNAFRNVRGEFTRRVDAVETLSVEELADYAKLKLVHDARATVVAGGRAAMQTLLAELEAIMHPTGGGGDFEEGGYGYEDDGLTAVHEALADQAREAVIAAYLAAREASPRAGVPQYRVGSRYAGGALLAGLRNPGFIYGDARGIVFGNVGILDEKAKQWKRLNFGAGAAGASGASHVANVGSGPFSVSFRQMEVVALGLDGSVQPAFFLPKGFWQPGYAWSHWADRGAFIPHNNRRGGANPAIFPTKGIRGEHWLDAGLAAIADGLSDAYSGYWRDILSQSADRVKRDLSSLIETPGHGITITVR